MTSLLQPEAAWSQSLCQKQNGASHVQYSAVNRICCGTRHSVILAKMNPITKAIVSNKFSSGFSSAEKSLGFGAGKKNESTDQATSLSAKEIRKLEDSEAARKAKKQREHEKRSAEREKKREEIREKYGLQKGNDGKERRPLRPDEEDPKRADEDSEDKNCRVM